MCGAVARRATADSARARGDCAWRHVSGMYEHVSSTASPFAAVWAVAKGWGGGTLAQRGEGWWKGSRCAPVRLERG